jgi:hypothetical protein
MAISISGLANPVICISHFGCSHWHFGCGTRPKHILIHLLSGLLAVASGRQICYSQPPRLGEARGWAHGELFRRHCYGQGFSSNLVSAELAGRLAHSALRGAPWLHRRRLRRLGPPCFQSPVPSGIAFRRLRWTAPSRPSAWMAPSTSLKEFGSLLFAGPF